MSPEDHGAGVVALLQLDLLVALAVPFPDVLFLFENAVDPTRHRIALDVHVLGRIEAALDVFERHIPDPRPVLPRSIRQPVVAGQRVGQDAEVGGALDVVVATEDVGAAARRGRVAQRQLQDAVGAGVVVAAVMLGPAHAPHHRAGAVVGHGPGDALHLRTGNAGHPFGFFRCPLLDLGLDLFQPVNALADEFLVFPSVLEDMPEDAPDQRDIGAGAEADEFVGMGRRPGEARVADDEGGVVLLFRLQDVLHGDRVGFRRVGADEEDGARLLDIVEVVGHGAVAPGVGHAGNCRRVTDASLVVTVVGAPEGVEFTEQVGLFIAELGRSQPVNRIRTGRLADFQHLVADLVDGFIPRNPFPFSAFQLHRILQAPFTAGEVPDAGALGAVAAEVEGVVEVRLLADPDTLVHLGDDAATDRTVGADGVDLGNAGAGDLGFGLLHRAQRQGGSDRRATGGQS